MKKSFAAFFTLTLALAVFSGCTQQGNESTGANAGNVSGLVVETGDTVSLLYRGTLDNGTVFDETTDEKPFKFVAGIGQVIVGFDGAVKGMRLNEEKTVTIAAEKAYGRFLEEKLAEVSKEQFNGVELRVGMPVHSSDGKLNGVIYEINTETVTVNFNHPLAGKDLTFWLKVVGIEKA